MTELRKILHADDNTEIREIVLMSLQMIGGFEVLQCESGAEAVERAFDFQPDLFLMDVMMPDMDGPEAVRILRQTEEFQDTLVVFATAKANKSDIEILENEFKAKIITKPLNPLTLADQLHEIWNSRNHCC